MEKFSSIIACSQNFSKKNFESHSHSSEAIILSISRHSKSQDTQTVRRWVYDIYIIYTHNL